LQRKPSRILIVDDELAVREVMYEGLRMAGYDCTTASNAAEALQRLEDERFALVLSDIEMPGGSGTELLRVIRERYADLDVIMITAIVDIDVALRAIRNGASDYLTKPFNLEQVKITVERTLEKRHLLQENREYQQLLEAKVEERTRELTVKNTEVRKLLEQLQETYQATLEALVQALDLRDTETQGHSLRVVEFTSEIAVALGIGEPEMTEIRRGALLHDIGKIGIPDAILRKPAKLTEEEWKVMRLHPELGHQMLAGIRFLEKPRDIVISHQERYDGTGYPRGLKGDQIPLGARIFAVADTFDAMTSTRPYRAGLPYDVARQEIIEWSGRQFDPAIVRAFVGIPPERWTQIRHEVSRKIHDEEVQTGGYRF
jgi:putative nucleotidyltransferase with HDIG domain